MKVSKEIRLKRFRLKDELFAYIRANLINQNEAKIKENASLSEAEKEEKMKSQSHLLVSSPVDPEFEMLVVGCAINLLEGLKKNKFRHSLETYKELLKSDLPHRERLIHTHKFAQREILDSNITLLQILIRLLARFKGGSIQEIKQSYMSLVEDFEQEQDLVSNRLRLRKYLRELYLNQKRILKVATEMALKKKGAQDSEQADLESKQMLREYKAKEFNIYLEALEMRMSESSTSFFDNSEEAQKDVDHTVFKQLLDKEIVELISEDTYPSLNKWVGRMQNL